MSEFKIGDRVRLNSRIGVDAGREAIVTGLNGPSPWGVEVRMADNGCDGLCIPEELDLIATPDPVNHPAHYTRFPVEVIDITEHLSFNLGNIVKYACRAGRKDGADPIEDLRKMLWYGQRELERLQKGAME